MTRPGYLRSALLALHVVLGTTDRWHPKRLCNFCTAAWDTQSKRKQQVRLALLLGSLQGNNIVAAG